MSENLPPSAPNLEDEAGKLSDEGESDIAPAGPSPLDEVEPEELIEWLESNPEGSRLLFATFSRFYSGPLPPPDILKGYEDVVPGSARTIIDKFAEQGEHRRAMEKVVVIGDNKRANWGMIAAFALAFLGVIGSFFTLNARPDAAGLGALVLSLTPLVTAFLATVHSRRKERREKDSISPE